MKNTIQFLRSESFIFIAILFVMMGQVLHTAYLFEGLRRLDLSFTANGQPVGVFNWIHAFVCASAVETAILMSILNGKKIAAQIYALGSFASNILYYAYWDQSLPTILSSTLMSAMLSGSIWFFSDLFARKVNETSTAEAEAREEAALLASVTSSLNGNGKMNGKPSKDIRTTLG